MLPPTGKTPANSMNALITSDIKNNGAESMFVRTKAGTYGLNPNWPKKDSESKLGQGSGRQPNGPESKNTRYVGTGGEYLVTGRLLLHGFNASLLAVDEGLDIVTIKGDRIYGVQVKTANKSAAGYVADISIGAYDRTDKGNTFYVFVLLGEPETYVILPFHVMGELINERHIKTIPKSNRYRAVFSKDGDTVYLGKKDIRSYVNKWNSIK